MPSPLCRMPFEQSIYELQDKIDQLEQEVNRTAEESESLRSLRRELADTTKEIYQNLDPWKTVRVQIAGAVIGSGVARSSTEPRSCERKKSITSAFASQPTLSIASGQM